MSNDPKPQPRIDVERGSVMCTDLCPLFESYHSYSYGLCKKSGEDTRIGDECGPVIRDAMKDHAAMELIEANHWCVNWNADYTQCSILDVCCILWPASSPLGQGSTLQEAITAATKEQPDAGH